MSARLDDIDEKLQRVQARIARDRAAGIPPRVAPEPYAPIQRKPAAPDPGTLEAIADAKQKRAMWESIKFHEPKLAELILALKAQGFEGIEVTTLRTADVNVGPTMPPWQSIVIRVDVTKQLRGEK